MIYSTSITRTIQRILSIYAVSIFVILWVGFIVTLLVNRELLDQSWNHILALPPIVKIIVWLLILPIMVGLWIWESSWSIPITLVALVGMIVWTALAVSSFIKAIR